MTSGQPVAAAIGLRGWGYVIPAWLAAYAARPFLLGFYDDDWAVLLIPAQQTAAFSWARLVQCLTLYANRPVNGLVTFVLSSVCNQSPMLWHCAIAILALGAAFAVRAFCRQLLRLNGAPPAPAAELAAALWLLFPWTMGVTAWPTTSPALVSVTCFALSGALLFEGWRTGRSRTVLPMLLFLASCLTYEFFYGQFIVLVLIGVLSVGYRRLSGGGGLVRLAIGLATMQLLAVAWNRVVPLFNDVAPSKTLYPLWWQAALESLRRMPHMIGHSTVEVSPVVEWLLLAGASVWGIVSVRRLWQAHHRYVALRELALILACGLGVVLSILVISLVNHRLKGLGLGSRTTTGVSLWLAVVLAVGLAGVPRTLRHARGAYVLALAGVLAVCTQARVRDWSAAWKLEQEILAGAPVADLSNAQPGAVVLFFGPYKHHGVRVFGATWNLNRALEYTYPTLSQLRFCEARDDRLTTWNGEHFEQRRRGGGDHPRRTVWNQTSAPELWIWEYGSNRARRTQAPFIHPLETARP